MRLRIQVKEQNKKSMIFQSISGIIYLGRMDINNDKPCSVRYSHRMTAQRPDYRVLDESASKESPLIATLRWYIRSARTLSWASYAGGFLRCCAERFNVARELVGAAKDGALRWAVIRWEYRVVPLSYKEKSHCLWKSF